MVRGQVEGYPRSFQPGETLDELKENIVDAYQMVLELESGPQHFETQIIEVGVEVKQKEFVRYIIRQGCYLHRHGSRHDIYANPRNGLPRNSCPAPS